MPNQVLQQDCQINSADIELDLTSAPYSGAVPEIWSEFDIAFNATFLTTLLGQSFSESVIIIAETGASDRVELDIVPDTGVAKWVGFLWDGPYPGNTPYAPTVVSNQLYHIKIHVLAGSPPVVEIWIDGISIGTIDATGAVLADIAFFDFQAGSGVTGAGTFMYVDNFMLGTTDGGTDLASDNFDTGSTPDTSIWNSFVSSASTLIADPGLAPPAGSGVFIDSAIISSKTTPIFIESPDEFAIPSSVTTLTGSYITESFTIHTTDYNWNPWSTAYNFDGSIPVYGCVGTFNDDTGVLT